MIYFVFTKGNWWWGSDATRWRGPFVRYHEAADNWERNK